MNKNENEFLTSLLKIALKIGGPGSGNFGHAGRPGLIGGSAPSKRSGPPKAYSGGGTAVVGDKPTVRDYKYAEMYWKGPGSIKVVEYPAAKKDNFANSISEKLLTYDPRLGCVSEIDARKDKYSMFLWMNQWIQEKRIEGKLIEWACEGIDFSEILPEPEDGVLY